MKIEIKINEGRRKSTKTDTNKNDEQVKDEQKKNTFAGYVKNMSWKQKLVCGGVATAVIMNALDNKKVEQPNIQYQEQYQQPLVSQNQSQNTLLDTPKTAEAKTEVINPIAITASDLLGKYSNATEYNDEKALNDFYKSKYLEITGVVESVADNTLILENDNNDKWYSDWMSVRCNIEDQHELTELNSIQIGKDVTVTGLCDGLDGLSVQMNNCYINENNLTK
jgi:hypothetical protein